MLHRKLAQAEGSGSVDFPNDLDWSDGLIILSVSQNLNSTNHMRAAEAKREGAPYFARVRVQPILLSLPGVRNLVVTRLAQRIPILNSLANLLLGVAERPRRASEVNDVSALSTWVTKLLGRTPSVPDRRSTATRTD